MTGSLTVRGRVLLVAAAVMALGGWLFGVQELYCLSVAALVLVSGARLWCAFRRWDLAVTRVVHPARVSAGHEARVELAVANPTHRASPTVEAHDPFEGGRRWARFSIAPLAPGGSRSSAYRLPATARGVYRLGPLELRLTDPFALATTTRDTGVESTLTVHPDYELVPVIGPSSHRDDDRHQRRPVLGQGGREFFTLREYMPGDDLRHVHWPSTARLDDLVIRQPENVRRGRLTVAVDLRSSVVDGPTAERLISAAASLAVSALRAGAAVRVVTTDGWDSRHGSGRAHGGFVLDGLAAACLHRARPGAVPFRLAGGLEPVVVVTTDRATRADLFGAFGMNAPGATTLVVFTTTDHDPGGGPGDRPGGRVVTVGPSDSFAAVWSRHAVLERA